MEVRVKKLDPNAIIPTYAKSGDAGLDLTAMSKTTDEYGNIVYGTGLAFEIPTGYVGLLFPRSSNCKKDLWMTNHVGVIDSSYRGEVKVVFRPAGKKFYGVGDRVAQLIIMPYPQIKLLEAEELSATERSENGFGSTGN